MAKKNANEKHDLKQLWHAVAKIVVGFALSGAMAFKYASPITFALAIVVGGIVLMAQGFAEFIVEFCYLKRKP